MLVNDDYYFFLMFIFEKDFECILWEEIQGFRIDVVLNV